MKFSDFVRQHWAAFRALAGVDRDHRSRLPAAHLGRWPAIRLHDKAEGSIVTVNGKPVGSRLIGQLFTDKNGNPLPQYFQSRPSAAGTTGMTPRRRARSNLGPESIVDTPADPAQMRPANRRPTPGSRPAC